MAYCSVSGKEGLGRALRQDAVLRSCDFQGACSERSLVERRFARDAAVLDLRPLWLLEERILELCDVSSRGEVAHRRLLLRCVDRDRERVLLLAVADSVARLRGLSARYEVSYLVSIRVFDLDVLSPE